MLSRQCFEVNFDLLCLLFVVYLSYLFTANNKNCVFTLFWWRFKKNWKVEQVRVSSFKIESVLCYCIFILLG